MASTLKPVVVWSGWDHSNIGDIGHTPGLLRTIEEFVPEARVVLVANQLDERIRAMLRRRFPEVEVHEGGLWEDDGERLRSVAAWASVFIRASNMGAGTEWMDWLIDREIPFGVYGQTFFPWILEQGDETPRTLGRIARTAFFYCRETLTLDLLRSAGLDHPHLRFVPDCCFGIDVRDEAGAAELMDELGLCTDGFLTMQLRTMTPAHADGELPPGYKPEWNRPKPDPAADLRRADTFVHLATEWVRRTGLKVLIAPEAKKEIAHNRRLIWERLPEDVRPQVANLAGFWTVEQAASVFAKARLVVCHEPHSPIIALANGTPAIHTYSLVHSPKFHMFADLGLGEWLFDHDASTAEDLTAAVFAIHENIAAARARVADVMNHVHELRRDSMAPVRKLLGLPASNGMSPG